MADPINPFLSFLPQMPQIGLPVTQMNSPQAGPGRSLPQIQAPTPAAPSAQGASPFGGGMSSLLPLLSLMGGGKQPTANLSLPGVGAAGDPNAPMGSILHQGFQAPAMNTTLNAGTPQLPSFLSNILSAFGG
jgi:hypothetical protein